MLVVGLAATVTVTVTATAAAAAGLPASVDRNADGAIVIGCLGDSNTSSRWQYAQPDGYSADQGWCEQLGALIDDPRVRVVNLGLGGATVTDNDYGGVPQARLHYDGSEQLAALLDTEPVDIVILSFGTNDVLSKISGVPRDIVDNYNRLWRRIQTSDVLGFVATTPPVMPHRRSGKYRRDLGRIAELNARLVETFAPRSLMDFETGFVGADYLDDIHLNAQGQAKRAAEAHRRIVAIAEVTMPPAGVRAVGWDRGHWARAEPADVSAVVAGD